MFRCAHQYSASAIARRVKVRQDAISRYAEGRCSSKSARAARQIGEEDTARDRILDLPPEMYEVGLTQGKRITLTIFHNSRRSKGVAMATGAGRHNGGEAIVATSSTAILASR
jgi:hypothetical protein